LNTTGNIHSSQANEAKHLSWGGIWNANFLQNDHAGERNQSVFDEVMMMWNLMPCFFMEHPVPVDMVLCW